MQNPIIIRTMRPTDLDFCLKCVTHEGWLSETRQTFEMFLANDHNGCFVAEIRGAPIGMCIATTYEISGFLGELIVVPERRGHGFGHQLMEHAIGYLRSRNCVSIYLDSDLPAIPLYERLGFRTLCDSLRFLGRIESQTRKQMRPLTASDLPIINTLDQEAFGADRSFLIRHRLEQYPTLARGLEREGDLIGYIMGQSGHDIVSVGPWLADTSTCDPIDLLQDLACHAKDVNLRIGVLETNSEAVARLRAIETFEETQPCRRMVLGPKNDLGRSNRLWALSSGAAG
ncbi:MAG: GNAT family N-acetyltransferase [candidate division Zixibacteria bacterium]|nr:GNAT family N-acetyltransferase [candidate division Zixibacteria bacterium]